MANISCRSVARIGMIVAITVIGAWISIPLPGGIPFSLQVCGVIASGLVLGPWLGALSQIVYVTLGVVGAPVFAGFGSGPAVLVGPSGGYLIGFVVGAFVVGMCRRRLIGMIIGCCSGIAIIHACGAGGLILWTSLPVGTALMVGVVPFIALDLVKALLVVTVVRRLHRAETGQ